MADAVVGIVMGSDSDWPLVKKACETLDKFGVAYETRVISAHRTPDVAIEYSKTAEERGLKVTSGRKGGRWTSERLDKWMRWLNGEKPAPAEQENATQEIEPAEGKDTTPEETPQEEPQSAMQAVPFEVSDMSATFVGEFDALKFMGWLSRLPMPGGNVKIRVDVTKV